MILEPQKFCTDCAKETPHREGHCVPCIERKLDEGAPREGEDVVAYAVRFLEMERLEAQRRNLPVISQKSFVRKCSKLRKSLEASVGLLRKGSDPPIDTADPTYVEHMRKITERREKEFGEGPMRWMDSLFATAERARRDPEYKKYLEKHAIHGEIPPSRMLKPHKGRAGRAARQESKITKRERTIELHGKGYTEVEIGKKIDRDPRTVRRYLTGR